MKTFKEFLNETSFKVGDKVKEVEPMGQFKPGDVLEIVRIKSGRIGVIAQGQNPKDALFDNPKNFKLVNEAKAERYKDLRAWKDNAENRGFKVSSPGVDPKGEVNKGEWFVAKDKQGNHKGEFDTRKGEGYFKS